jgi:hypothetical protein
VEDILEHLLEVFDDSLVLVDVVEARELNEPRHVVTEQLVAADPVGQHVPFHWLAAVDADAPLGVLVLAHL